MSAEAATLLGLLSDEDRLLVFAALALGARTPSEVAESSGLDVPRAGKALARLTSGGLVEQEKDGYVLVTERFRDALESLERPSPEQPDSGLGPDADKVLKAFLRGGRLTSIPVVHSKRLVVLDYLARLFVPGEAYPEKVVNERLGAFHPDFAALRRYMVEDEFLHRRDGFYWRAGGTFDVDPDPEE
ncbi:MAG: DUF2087 domain-containing protein [Acidimicrobiia bacterium]